MYFKKQVSCEFKGNFFYKMAQNGILTYFALFEWKTVQKYDPGAKIYIHLKAPAIFPSTKFHGYIEKIYEKMAKMN